MFPLASVLVSPLVPSIVAKFDRHNVMCLAIFLMSLQFLVFGLIHNLEVKWFYILLAFLMRLG